MFKLEENSKANFKTICNQSLIDTDKQIDKKPKIDFDISKIPLPLVVPVDSNKTFAVDTGTYLPPESDVVLSEILQQPSPCSSNTSLLIGVKGVVVTLFFKNILKL